MPVPLTAACIAVAASLFQVPEPTLWTILKVEGGRVGACTPQANGTHDCGPAQVNAETWVPQLAALLHRPGDEIFAKLRDDGCFNIWAAAYVLSIDLKQAGGDLWEASGLYHSATPVYKVRYQSRLIAAYEQLFGVHRRAAPGGRPG